MHAPNFFPVTVSINPFSSGALSMWTNMLRVTLTLWGGYMCVDRLRSVCTRLCPLAQLCVSACKGQRSVFSILLTSPPPCLLSTASLTEPGVHQFCYSSWLGSSRNLPISTTSPGTIISTQEGPDSYSGAGELNSVLHTVLATPLLTELPLKDLVIISHGVACSS